MKLYKSISSLATTSCLSLLITMSVMAQTSEQDKHQHKNHAATGLSLN
jgi:hypothetical protein